MALTLAYTEHGKGAPLVILHGLFGSARNWQAIAKRLAPAYRVYALDLRNHGDSPWSQAMSYADMADDVRGFIEGEGLERPALLGHSMGGKAAMVLALARPALVRALIVIDIAPVAYPHSFLPYVQAMQGVDLASIERRGQVETALAQRIADAGIRQFLLQNLRYREGRYAWRLNLEALTSNMPELLDFPRVDAGAYDGPTLFVHGGRSTYVRPEHRQPIRQLFPQAKLHELADAGHWLHVDQPQAFTDTVRGFLETTAG